MSNTAIVSLNESTGKFDAVFKGETIASVKKPGWLNRNLLTNKRAVQLNVTRWEFAAGQVAPKTTKTAKTTTPVVVEQSRFGVNERFDFMAEAVKMVLNEVTASVIITGEGGIGKSYTVLEELANAGLRQDYAVEGTKDTDFIIVKGASTAKALFRLLQTHNHKTIVFDDCDSVLKDATSINLLKSALDSYGDRWITWNAESKDDLERSFKFTGKVIFISNMHETKMDQAVLSRSMVIDLSMTIADKITRMWKILPDLDLPDNVTSAHRQDAMEWIVSKKDDIRDLNFRTLIKVAKIRAGVGAEKWANMAEYITVGG